MNHDIVVDFNFNDYVDAVGVAFYGDPKPKDPAEYPFNQYAPVSEFQTILSPNHTYDPARHRLDKLKFPALILGIDDVQPSKERSIGNGQQMIDFTMKAFLLYPREYKYGDREITRNAMKVAAFVYQTRRFGQQVTPALLIPEETKAGEPLIENNDQVQCRSVCWEHTTCVGEDLYPPVLVGEPLKIITNYIYELRNAEYAFLTTEQTFEWQPEHWTERQYDLYHEASQQP